MRKKIDWDNEPWLSWLGKMADTKLGDMLGISRQAVHEARKKRGIPAFHGEGKPTNKKGIDWDAEKRLGKMPDEELARLLDVHKSRIQAVRAQRGIPALTTLKRVSVDNDKRLGRMPDTTLARLLGVSTFMVHTARTSKGIPSFNPPSQKGIDWDSEKRLGKMPDEDLARLLDVSRISVLKARKVRGIPAFKNRGR